MGNFYQTLENTLKKDKRFIATDGTLMRNAVFEEAMKMDASLIRLLLSDGEAKKRFFTQIDDTQVFDKQGFAWAINNKAFLPDSYTRFKNKIGLADENEEMLSSSGKVELVFPYKDCVLEGGQTKDDQKRNEVFYNETLAPDEIDRLFEPKVFTNAVRYAANGSRDLTGGFIPNTIEVVGEKAAEIKADDNLIIKGNNILSLYSLLPRYRRLIKMIYIDPPYFFNKVTPTDTFKYNSNFHLSTWLTFMRNRLTAAKELLAKGGTIWINVGEDGMHYLKVLADEIFGKESFVGTLPRRARNGNSDVPFNLSQDFDWILVYTNVSEDEKVLGRSVERQYFTTSDYPNRPWRLADLTCQQTASKRPNSFFTLINPKDKKEYPASAKRTWAVTKETFQEYYDRGYIVFPGDYDFLNISKPYSRKFKDEDDANPNKSAVISDFLISDFITELMVKCKNAQGNEEIANLFSRDDFDYAKPENLIRTIIEVATVPNDIVLDFHLGSGTTAAVAHKMGRRYIGLEQMDCIETLCVERLKKVIAGEQGGVSEAVKWQGGGSFVYCELAKLNQKFAEEIETAENDKRLEDIYHSIIKSGFISYRVDIKKIDGAAKDYERLSMEDKRRFLMEILDKNLLYVNYCDIDDAEFGISDEDKRFSKSFYKEG